MVNVETIRTSYDEPRLVVREDWTGSMKLGDVQRHGLGSRGCICDLVRMGKNE